VNNNFGFILFLNIASEDLSHMDHFYYASIMLFLFHFCAFEIPVFIHFVY